MRHHHLSPNLLQLDFHFLDRQVFHHYLNLLFHQHQQDLNHHCLDYRSQRKDLHR
jgi:hypothetical protein